MSNMPANAKVPLPRWVIQAASAAIILHLGALLVLFLGAQSGPWFSPFGRTPADPPEFAGQIDRLIRPWYFFVLSLDHDSQSFARNDPEEEAVYLEALLKDKSGTVVQTLTIPDPGANFWVRHRQGLLVQGLADDIPVQAPRGEVIPGEKQKGKTVSIWDALEGAPIQNISTIPEILIPRNRDVFGPTERAQLLAKSYARYLCREHRVPTVELIRYHRKAIFPEYMVLLPEAFDGQACSFGDYSFEE
jgi:hypothetical protein